MKSQETKKYLFAGTFGGKITEVKLCQTCSQLVINDLFDSEFINSLINYEENGMYYSMEQIILLCSRYAFLSKDSNGKKIKNEEDENYREEQVFDAITSIGKYCNENH